MAASWTNTKTWAYTDALAYTEVNGYIGTNGNLDFLANRPYAQASRSTNLSVTASTWTKVTLPDAEDRDTHSFHSTSTNSSRFTIPTGLGGLYVVNAFAEFASDTSGSRAMRIIKNNTTSRDSVLLGASTTVWRCSASQRWILAANDYVELEVWQSSGANLNLTAARVELLWESF